MSVKQLTKIMIVVIFSLIMASCENPILVDATKLYTVKFETNCDTRIDSYRTKKVENIPVLQKTDAAFVGWFTNAAFSGHAVSLPLELECDTTLYAKWSQKYTIVFETNGGTGIASYKAVEITESPDTMREGYYFAGWYEQSDFGGVAVTFPYVLSEKTTLYAKWLKIYTVSFETNGGTEIQPYEISVITNPPVSTRKGYTLVGWYKESAFANLVTFPYTLISDTTLYALWEDASNAFYTVEHYQQNTDLETYSLIKTEKISGEAGNQTEAIAQSYTGFTNKLFTQSTIAEDNSTVISIYYDRNKYTVTFDANGGSGNTVTQEFYYGVIQSLSKNSYTFPRYIFSGWTTEEGGSVKYTDSANFSTACDTTVYAVWEELPKYTVRFDANSGTGTMESQTFYYGEGNTLKANVFTKDGCTFEGWATTESGPCVYTDGQFVSDISASTTLYAVWFYGCIVTDETISSLDLTNLTDAYTIRVTGSITQSDLAALAGKIENAEMNITLDLSETTGLITISSKGNGKSIFENCTIPFSIILPNTVTTIASCAFVDCPLYDINFPASLKTIGGGAFNNTNLKEVVIDGVETIDRAFVNCSSLESIEIKNITTISNEAFSHCSQLKTANIENVQIIGSRAFSYCSSLQTVYLSDIGELGEYSFGASYLYTNKENVCYNLKNAYLTNIKSIGDYAFANCYAIEKVKLINVSTIGEYAFYKCTELSSVYLENIETIKTRGFSGCSKLASVEIDAITIGQGSFSNCRTLSAVNIGKSVTSIENYYDFSKTTSYDELELVFANCNNLTSVNFEDTSNWYYTRTNPKYSEAEFSLDVSIASINASMLSNSNTGSQALYKWYKKTE